jgi:Fe2+ transport system protein FeoA
MGLVPGTEIDVIMNSSRGPFIVAVKGCRIILGHGMAHKIMVT